MPDVLGAMENAEGKTSEEIPGRQIASNWSELEPGHTCNATFKVLPEIVSKSMLLTFQEDIDVLKLRYVVLSDTEGRRINKIIFSFPFNEFRMR